MFMGQNNFIELFIEISVFIKFCSEVDYLFYLCNSDLTLFFIKYVSEINIKFIFFTNTLIF